MKISLRRRLVDLFWTLLFVLFFIQFLTMVKLNLHDIAGVKEFAVCFFFPFVVVVLSIIRFFSGRYMNSPFLIMFSNSASDETYDDQLKYISGFIYFVLIGGVMRLSSFALVEKGYMSAGYNLLEKILAISFAGICFLMTIYFLVRKQINKKIVLFLILPAFFGAIGWMFGSSLRTLYEVLFLYPEVLRW